MSDLISRCELFNRLAPVQTLGEAYGIIQRMDTVDSVPVRHGRWKRKIVDCGFNADWVCSQCGHRVMTDFVNYKYCPNCGARMGGKGNGDETD